MSLGGLWLILVFVGVLFLGRATLRLIKAVREPMFIAFSTAGTEAAFPTMVESLTRFGVDRRTTGRGNDRGHHRPPPTPESKTMEGTLP